MLDREAEDIEAGRLFYVAATRAESRLHLLGCVKVDEDGVVKMPSRRSLLGIAWEALGDQIVLPGVVPAQNGEGRAPLPAELKRLPAAFRLPDPPEAVRWTAPEEGRDEVEIEFSWAKEAVRHAGIVAHAWLQRIAEDELEGWGVERVEALRSQFTRDLQRRGVAPGELERATNLITTALKNAITDERGRWLLGRHPVARSEYRLRNRRRSFRIDRYIEDAQGTKWVADYKLSEHEGAGIGAFLDEQRKRYAAQLDAYAQAVGEARRGLYFPLPKGWREW